MNANKFLSVGVGCLLASVAAAVDWPTGASDVVLGSDAERLGTGTVTAPTSASVRSLSAYPAEGETVTIAGGPLALQPGAVVSNASAAGELVLAAAATGTDGLRFGAPVPATVTFADLRLGKSDSLVAEGMNLDDYDLHSAVSCGKDISVHEMSPQRVVRSPGSCAVQFQYDDGTWIKCVKLILSQSGSDVVGRAVYARYMRYNYGLGHDFDMSFVGEVSVAPTVDSFGYGIQKISFCRRGAASGGVTRVAGEVAANGPVAVDAPASVVFSGSSIGLLASTLRVDGRLTIGDMTDGDVRTLATSFSGTGGKLTFGPSAKSALGDVVVTDPVAKGDTSAKLISTTMMLGDVAGFADITISKDPGQAFFPKWNYGKLSVQFQAFHKQSNGDYEGYVKGFVVTFAQTESGLTATRESANYYLWGYPSDVGTDLTVNNSGANGSYSLDGYTVLNGSKGAALVNLTGANAMQGGEIVIASNTLVRVKTAGALPEKKATRVTIRNGGILDVAVAGGAKGLYPIRVLSGGLLRSSVGAEVFGYANVNEQAGGSAIVLEGGTLDFVANGNIADESGSYASRLQLQDGAHVKGHKARVGLDNVIWYVRGTSPSYVENGFLIVGQSNANTFTLDVADVTGNGDVDLYQTGAFRDYGSVAQTSSTMYGIVCKTGAGTWLLDACCPGFWGEVRVEAGTLCLGRSNVLPDVGAHATDGIPAFTLKGGALATAAGTENAIRHLALRGDSSISLAPGSALAFGDSSALTWTDGKQLTVSGLENASLRFGTSAAGLTESQIKAIRVLRDGRLHKVILDEGGYLRQYDSGLMLLFR